MPLDVFRFPDKWPECCFCLKHSARDPGSLPTFLHRHLLISPQVGCQMRRPSQTAWHTYIPFDFQAFSATTAGTAVHNLCYDLAVKGCCWLHNFYWASTNGVQVAGHQGYKLPPTLTCRKKKGKTKQKKIKPVTLCIQNIYLRMYHSSFTAFVCGTLRIFILFYF